MTKGKIISIVDKLSFDRYLRTQAPTMSSPPNIDREDACTPRCAQPAGDFIPDIPGLDRININVDTPVGTGAQADQYSRVPGCMAAGKTLGELDLFERYGVIVLFLWKSGTFLPEPEPKTLQSTTRPRSFFLAGRIAIVQAIRDEFRL